MEGKRALGLYVHIPFCKSKCVYCDFYSLPHSEEKMDAYADALRAQLRAFAPRAADHRVDSVYFGGGTPSYFGAARLCALLKTIFDLYDVTPDAEITLEANPESARSVDALHALHTEGFNRISLGMQSADDDELRAIGRIHTNAQTAQAVACARQAGFSNLSLDLIYGLPTQTSERWRKNLSAAIALAPEHLSCYGLKAEPGTPLYAIREQAQLPDDEAQAEMYLETVETLARSGYPQYEISNFARPGRESRHNLKYWTLGEYLGFGPGAHSDFGGRRFAWARDLDAFLAGEIERSEDSVIAPRSRAAEYLMLGLRTTRGIRAEECALPFGPAEKVLRECEQHGLAEYAGERWRLTPQGFLVSNAIIVRVLEAMDL